MSIKALASEIKNRFPEISSSIHEGDEDLPYVMMGYIAEWLSEQYPHHKDPSIAQRLSLFCQWCESQPQGKTAADDILTILCVALYEKLIESSTTRILVHHLIPRHLFTKNVGYFTSHCGSDAVAATLKEYENYA